MDGEISIAIETTCSHGGLALGRGGVLARTVDFDATSRHATQLVSRLAELLAEEDLAPDDLSEVHVSVGPGSFTGTRVGVTVARTLAQAVDSVRLVAVPTVWAVAANARGEDFERLAVVLDARQGEVHVSVFERSAERIVPLGQGRILPAADLADELPTPILLIGEGLRYHAIRGAGLSVADPDCDALHLPRAAEVWRVGRELAAEGQFTPPHRLCPVYVRRPEAERLWDARERTGLADEGPGG
jgi:tRNA threonylcarbamoyladenosine biosynthesis protein TsaB